jgi:uncharacterized surface protein with fasciclin (FAS1) repeats
MTRWIRTLAAATLLSLLSLLSACGGGSTDDADIVALAQRAPTLSTLAEAVEAAGLAKTLSSGGPYTVLAPTNDAFDALLGELGIDKAALLADRTLLRSVLRLHVLPGRLARADIPLGRAIEPLDGGFFKIDAAGAHLVATDGRNRMARLQATDLVAANGLVHVIDRVLLPADRPLIGVLQADGGLGRLAEALAVTGLSAMLSGSGPFTLFAPTDAAFDALAAQLALTPAQLLADVPLLTRLLEYHVVDARVLRAEVPLGVPVTTRLGRAVTASAGVDARLRVTDECGCTADVVRADLLGANGVIHVIDKVLQPAP